MRILFDFRINMRILDGHEPSCEHVRVYHHSHPILGHGQGLVEVALRQGSTIGRHDAPALPLALLESDEGDARGARVCDPAGLADRRPGAGKRQNKGNDWLRRAP
jgi:hypothetical protein